MDHAAFLAAVRRRLRWALAVEGGARVVATVTALLALLVVADFLWFLPGWLRLGGELAVVAAGLGTAWRRLWLPLATDLGDRVLAAHAERRLPELGGRLFTAVDALPLGGEEPALRSALTPAAVRALVPARKLPSRLLAAAAVVLAVAGVAAVFPRELQDGLRRLAMPLSDADWQRRTRLEGSLERAVVAADEKVVVHLRRHHPRADFSAPVELSWRTADGGGDSRRLGGLVGPAWTQALALTPGRWTIEATSADALPFTLVARVVRRPVLARVEAVVRPPAYAHRPEQRLDTLSLTALAGSRVEFTAAFTHEPDRAPVVVAMRAPGLAAAPLSAADGRWKGGFTVAAGGELELTAADADGIACQPAPRFPLTLVEDRAPVVAIEGPRRTELVGPRARVALELVAQDDIGLADLALLGAVSQGEEKAAPARELMTTGEVAGQVAARRKLVLEVAALAAPGGQVVLTGRARDANDVTGPGVGLSEPVVLRVVTDEQLRQEFDRLLGEARDQVVRAREELAAGLAKPERLAASARQAAQGAARAGELAAQVARRWRENALPADQIEPVGKAAGLLAGAVCEQLARGAAGDAPAARSAEAGLGEAERLLASLLSEGDLTRLLASLVARQQALGEETRTFVRAWLVKPPDAPARAQLGNLAARQKDIAEATGEIERRILAGAGQALAPAQELVRARPPAERLRQAGGDLAGSERRAQAVEAQQNGLEGMKKLLDLLRGSDAAGSLAEALGRLAAEEERLSAALDRGADPGAQAAAQRDLQERTAVLAQQLAAKSPSAAAKAQAAAKTQESAAKAMARGDRAAAARDAAAAAALLREAQRELSPEPPPERPDTPPDLLTVLRQLRSLQAKVVADASGLDQRLAGKELDFGAVREVAVIARDQGGVLLRLREDVVKPLERQAVARMALERVAAAMAASQTHLERPALGERGVRLARVALAELTRLIDIAASQPKTDGGGGGGGDGKGDGQKPPFPPHAELSLLAAMQSEVADATAGNRPTDLSAAQGALRDLVENATQAARPGSRGQLLLERTRRAMASAAWRLGERDRGLATRHEQAAAEAALRRLLAEADGGGGGSDNQPQDQPQARDQRGEGQQPPPAGQQPPGQGESPGTPAGGQDKPGSGTRTASAVVAAPERGEFMNLPPAIRDRLIQARDQGLTPRQREVFKVYLQNLEEGR